MEGMDTRVAANLSVRNCYVSSPAPCYVDAGRTSKYYCYTLKGYSLKVPGPWMKLPN
jgi:hypothetical protein